jgi:predicted RNase H-like nuclease (RuvC/YqgF family)
MIGGSDDHAIAAAHAGDEDDDDEDDVASDEEEQGNSAKRKRLADHKKGAKQLAYDLSPEGQKIEALEQELETMQAQYKRMKHEYKQQIKELTSQVLDLDADMRTLRATNKRLVDALGTMGKDAPSERNLELLRKTQKIARAVVFQQYPFLENKVKQIKAAGQVAGQLIADGDLEDTEEAEAHFTRNYKAIVRDKMNQERSYRVSCIQQAVVCKSGCGSSGIIIHVLKAHSYSLSGGVYY